MTAGHAPVGLVRADVKRGPTLTPQSLRRAVVRVSLCCFALPHVSVCPAARLCAPCVCEGVCARCTATMRAQRATGFPDTEGHVRGGAPRTGPSASSPPPRRSEGLDGRALPHDPRSLSTPR